MPILTVAKPLREKLGDEAVDTLIDLINGANEKVKEDVIEIVGERFEKRLIQEISRLETKFTQEISRLETKISNVYAKVSEVKADLIRWMFIFWIGQVGVFVGIVFLILKAMKPG